MGYFFTAFRCVQLRVWFTFVFHPRHRVWKDLYFFIIKSIFYRCCIIFYIYFFSFIKFKELKGYNIESNIFKYPLVGFLKKNHLMNFLSFFAKGSVFLPRIAVRTRNLGCSRPNKLPRLHIFPFIFLLLTAKLFNCVFIAQVMEAVNSLL